MKNSKGMIILLVALAALTLVVVVGLFFFYPKEQPKAPNTVAGTSSTDGMTTPLPDEFDPVEWTRNPQPTPIQTPSVQPADEQGFTVTLPPETSVTPTQSLPPSPGATFPGEVATPAPVVSAPVAAPKPVAKVVPKSIEKPVVKTVKVTEYWIQVASFKDRYQAENTAKSLESQGLKGTLTTATVNGQAVVRVRVGPYANQDEAQKFLAWLTPVKEFAGSYVTKVSASRAH